MKTIEEFRTFYSNDMLNDLQKLDDERKAIVKKVIRNFFIYLLIVVGLIALSLFINFQIYDKWIDGEGANVPVTIAVILSIIGIFILGGVNRKAKRGFNQSFKNNVIGRIVKFIDESLKFESDQYIAYNDFHRSDIFRQHADRYYGDDLVYGKIDKTDISFSEIHAAYKTTSSDDNGSKEKWQKLFDGIFFIADFHKNFKGRHFVLPDFAEKSFGSFGKFFQKMNKGRGQLIELEDPEFEKEFAVYGNDQVEARYILSSSMMRRILEFKKSRNKNIMISFVDSRINIAIPYTRRLFEPRFYSSLLKQEKNEEYFCDLNSAISIVEELNLNTRIWGKE